MNKKQLILAAGVLLVFLGYAVYQKTSPNKVVTPATVEQGTSAPLEGTNPQVEMGEQDDDHASVTGATLKVTAPGGGAEGARNEKVIKGPFKDGVYVGEKVDAFYGPMQVKAVVTGGKLTDIQFLAYPDAAGTTLQKTQAAMPMLKESAIASQSSNVDAISGSTQTREGFELSLYSALAKAK